MALEEYKRKRKFEETPEPAGQVKKVGDELSFVVHKHQASHLHWDLRLEMGGILKSWAVPKGPSMNPKDKRLAMMVEDHPYDYREFEGVIPEGNYGAGTVMIWDKGTYKPKSDKGSAINKKENERILQEMMGEGHFSIIFNGQKLRGEFRLVRLKRGGEKSWLLIKKNDEFAIDEDIQSLDKSAKSGLSMEEIASGAKKKPILALSSRNRKVVFYWRFQD